MFLEDNPAGPAPLTSRSVPAKVAPRRLQFFSLAFFRVATRRLIPVIWLPSMSTPFRFAPDERWQCVWFHERLRLIGRVLCVSDWYLPGWPSVQTDLQSCILWEKLPRRWYRASSRLVSWLPSKDGEHSSRFTLTVILEQPQVKQEMFISSTPCANTSIGICQTYVQVGSGEIRPLQVGAAQVGVHQVAAAQVRHLEIDVAQIEAGQIGTAEIKTLKKRVGSD